MGYGIVCLLLVIKPMYGLMDLIPSMWLSDDFVE